MNRSRYQRRRGQRPHTKRTSEGGRIAAHGESRPIHIQRTPARIIIGGDNGTPTQMVPAFVLINEMSSQGLWIFSESHIRAGEHVMVSIPELQNFFVKARIIASKDLNLSGGILTTTGYRFRLQIRFEFGSEAERKAVADFCAYLNQEYLSAA